jgi:hypothetical protein
LPGPVFQHGRVRLRPIAVGNQVLVFLGDQQASLFEGDLLAYSLWRELAYRLAGVEGYRRVQEADRKHVAAGADTLRELFKGEPTLIMLDEVSV